MLRLLLSQRASAPCFGLGARRRHCLTGQTSLQGTRFAILHGDGPKPSLTVYNMKVRKALACAVHQLTGTGFLHHSLATLALSLLSIYSGIAGNMYRLDDESRRRQVILIAVILRDPSLTFFTSAQL